LYTQESWTFGIILNKPTEEPNSLAHPWFANTQPWIRGTLESD
jgi:hypothetical protein